MFIDEVIRSVSNKQPFNADAFHQRVTQFEIDYAFPYKGIYQI